MYLVKIDFCLSWSFIIVPTIAENEIDFFGLAIDRPYRLYRIYIKERYVEFLVLLFCLLCNPFKDLCACPFLSESGCKGMNFYNTDKTFCKKFLKKGSLFLVSLHFCANLGVSRLLFVAFFSFLSFKEHKK